MILWNNSRKRTNLWNNGREKTAPWIIFIIILIAAKGVDFSQNGFGPTYTMEQQTNNFHSRKISISDIFEIPTISIYQNMPGARGRPKSPWWSYFQTVDGRIVSSCYVLSLLSICPGDFRVVKCLHCDQIVRRGKVGCAAKETSNSGMAHHMRSKHPGESMEVERLFSYGGLVVVYREKSLIRSFSCPHGKFWPWMAVEWCFVNTISKWWLKK